MHNIIVYFKNRGVKNLISNTDKRYYFLNLGINKGIEMYLFKRGHLNIESIAVNANFTKEYLRLMDSLSLQYQSKHWWATFTAAKNHHISTLFDNLSSFLLLISFINNRKNKNLDILVIEPSNGIFKSIKKFCLKRSIPIKTIGRNFPLIDINIGFYIKNSIIILLRAFLIWYKMLIIKFIFYNKMSTWFKNLNSKIFLLKTWIYTNSFDKNGGYIEKIFGKLPPYLLKNNKRILVIGGIFSSISQFKGIVQKLKDFKDYTVVPQEYFLKLFDPFKIYFEALTNRPKVNKVLLRNSLDITELVQYHLDIDFSKSFFNQLLHYPIMKNILKKITVNTYIYTYEHNPWEKMYLFAIRDYSPLTKTIGYQHTILSMAKLNFNLGEQERKVLPFPDKIVTNGEVTKALLINQKNNPSDKIVIGCALRFEKLLSLEPKSLNYNKDSINVLLPLEGVFKSAEIINFTYGALKNNRKYKLVIRPHPALPIERMKSLLCFNLNNLAENVVISKRKDVFQDLGICDFVIYDGTTVALEAVMLGIPIIYVDINKIINIDTLFQNNYLKKTVSSIDELVPALEHFLDMNEDSFDVERSKAREYIKKYFYNVTDENLKPFLN